MRRFIRADITTPPMAKRINYPQGWYDNVEKILVRIYDDVSKKCLAEIVDEDLFMLLMATGRVEELTEAEMDAELTRLRPPPDDVVVTLRGNGKDYRTAIDNVLKNKGLKYRIDDE